MLLSEIKTSAIPKRKLFQIERAIVREITDLWCNENVYFPGNFAENVAIDFFGNRVKVTFSGKDQMIKGSPEATVNEMMRGLILTMAADQETGELIDNYRDIIGNVLDVFVHRLKEIGERKFIFQRLQTLELGFGVNFGLGREFYPVKKVRPILDDILMGASQSKPEETAQALISDIRETEAMGQEEHGVTFHIITIKKGREASFISLPLGSAQASYVSLLGTHTLRCNIIGKAEGADYIRSGILKIDAPSHPLNFIRHKAMNISIDQRAFMEKLSTGGNVSKENFSADELTYLKLLFNEYVQLACFLLNSKRIDKDLRLLIIFPRANIFKILHAETPQIPADEPQTLGELAALFKMLFKFRKSARKKKSDSPARIPERVIQEKVYEAIMAFSRNIIRNIYKPITGIKRDMTCFMAVDCRDQSCLLSIKERVENISAYLRKLKSMQRVIICKKTGELDLEASVEPARDGERTDALDEIIQNIQAEELEQIKEVIVSKMLAYLSFVSMRTAQIEKVSSPYIKEEIVKAVEDYSQNILVQAKSFYRFATGKSYRGR